MRIVVRRALEADWSAIIALHRRAAAHERMLTDTVSDSDIADAQHRFRGDLDVALLDGRLAGFVSRARNEIAWLYVEPALFRRGVGTALLQHALEECGFVAHVRVLAGNLPMLALCESRGFVAVGEETMHGPHAILLRRLGNIASGRVMPMTCRTQ